jgi:putative transposase
VPPHYSSQNCSNCGKVVKKSLSVRTHICPHCGHTQDRDWNAARNILEKGLRTVGHTGTSSEDARLEETSSPQVVRLELGNASGDIDHCLGEATPPSKSGRGKRKSKEQSLESPCL